ncbi:aldo/keto reductase [Opitutaceae bacterium EW11]|nr:aldo/keto reductase [Opitutaceae bacterium EW11]
MPYRRLGKSGVKVSALSFGAWVTFGKQIGTTVADDLLHAAYEAGVNFFDNAEAYADGKAEEMMGEVLKRAGWRRSSFLVSSKVFFGSVGEGPTEIGLSRKHVFDACHAALKRLQVDYLDFYLCHRPDPETPIEETARAMHDLVAQGKVLYWGTSEWSAAQIEEAHAVCSRLNLHPPTMEQPQYNLFHRSRVEKEFAPLYKTYGMGTTIWSPLASGLLTGKYNQGIPSGSRLDVPGLEWLRDQLLGPTGKAKIDAVQKLSAVAKELGVTLPQLAIAWCLKNENVSTVILGASRVEQLKENLRALEALPLLTADVLRQIERITKAHAE